MLRKADFDKIGDVLKKAKSNNDQLKEIKELTILLESQRNYIAMLENEKGNKSIKKIISYD